MRCGAVADAAAVGVVVECFAAADSQGGSGGAFGGIAEPPGMGEGRDGDAALGGDFVEDAARGDAALLGGVAHQQHPGAAAGAVADDVGEVAVAELAGFVDDDESAGGDGAVGLVAGDDRSGDGLGGSADRLAERRGGCRGGGESEGVVMADRGGDPGEGGGLACPGDADDRCAVGGRSGGHFGCVGLVVVEAFEVQRGDWAAGGRRSLGFEPFPYGGLGGHEAR